MRSGRRRRPVPTERKVKPHPLSLARTWPYFMNALRHAGTEGAAAVPYEAGRCNPGQPGADPEFFFPENSDGRLVRRAKIEAKGFCSRCEVIDECLAGALDRGERYGVYGGLDERERRQLAQAWQQAKEERLRAAEEAWQAKIGSGV